eukprot:TRINITY_DN332_c3_g1_i1.p1 TRINITY_DN332_c3_g1~~TRINITY_DN332_c3_g1_i1.p1  ORF type:complete len:258 (-),score=60.11 TRINITY_DN332_c3_g1_i1:49-822(-)
MHGIEVDITPQPGDDATVSIKGSLEFDHASHHRWPRTLLQPGVMGYLAYASSLLECNHGVMSMHFDIKSGVLAINGRDVDFSGGHGYVEKDWGLNFPQNWIWTQSHFTSTQPTSSLFLSVAGVPLMGLTMPGFICGFLHEGTLHTFATYKFDTISILKLSAEFASVVITGSGERLEVNLTRPPLHHDEGHHHATLYAPSVATKQMEKYVVETLAGASASVAFWWTSAAGAVREFRGASNVTGLEIMGDLSALRGMFP